MTKRLNLNNLSKLYQKLGLCQVLGISFAKVIFEITDIFINNVCHYSDVKSCSIWNLIWVHTEKSLSIQGVPILSVNIFRVKAVDFRIQSFFKSESNDLICLKSHDKIS